MEKETFIKKFGKNITTIREEMKLTQVEFGNRCKKSKQNIYRLESGAINPSAFYLHEMAKNLKIPVSRFYEF
jgi:transcriptional regulator with XRE-family HTH domain